MMAFAPEPIGLTMRSCPVCCDSFDEEKPVVMVEYREVAGVPYSEEDGVLPWEYVCLGCGWCS